MKKVNRLAYKEGYRFLVVDPFTINTGIFAYAIKTPYIELTPAGKLTLSSGYAWDGASGPAVNNNSIIRGSAVHDALYQLIREDLLPFSLRKTADDIFIRICKEDGMWAARRWWVLLAVNTFGARAIESRNPVLFAPEK